MVIFRGGQVKHYTEVESGEVHLLGPFGARSLESVGGNGHAVKASKVSKVSKSSNPHTRRALKLIE
jgi:hypothetical protein